MVKKGIVFIFSQRLLEFSAVNHRNSGELLFSYSFSVSYFPGFNLPVHNVLRNYLSRKYVLRQPSHNGKKAWKNDVNRRYHGNTLKNSFGVVAGAKKVVLLGYLRKPIACDLFSLRT